MNDFEFLAGFFGVILGLIATQLAAGLADGIDNHRDYPVGLLTLLLGAFVLCDVTSFWVVAWSLRDAVRVSMVSVLASTGLGIIYYLSAALVFPRDRERWQDMDTHYWARKRIVLGGILLVNGVVTGWQVVRVKPELSDTWFFVIQGFYFLPLITLLFTRRRKADLLLLGWLLVVFALSGADAFPHSQWGDASLLNPTS
jgi:hypothetical protein